MSLLVFLLACGLGAGLSLAVRPNQVLGRLAGFAGLLVAFAASLEIGSATSLTLGDVTLVGTSYSGLFLACALGSALLVCVVALAAGWPDELAPAALASFAGLAIALTARDSSVALAAGAAAATAGALVILRAAPAKGLPDGRLAEIRTIGLVAVALMLAGLTVNRPPWSDPGDGPILVIVFLGLAGALAVRSGAVPFHVPASHLGQTAQAFAPAVLLVWIPAGLGLLALSWSATVFGRSGDLIDEAVGLVQIVAVATIVLGGLAALVHDELEEVVAYSIVADAGFLLLALAARTDAAAQPARLWLLVFVAAKTGLVAWAAALARAFGTSNLARLRGWLRRTPLLGIALVVIALATVGWPGSDVYQSRSTLVSLALPGALQFLPILAVALTVAYSGRLLVIGVLAPTANVAGTYGERPRWVALAAAAIDAEGTGFAGPGSMAPSESAVDATAIASVPAPDPQRAPEPAQTGRRRRGSQAAAASNPTVAAAVPAGASEASAAGDAAAPADPSAPVSPPDSRQPGDGANPYGPSAEPPRKRSPMRPQLAAAWQLNRTLEVSLVVIAGTFLAVVLAFGGFGAPEAATSGIPLDRAAHATPTPTPVPSPSTPAATAMPSLVPFPSGSPAPSASVSPSPVPTPLKTSGPAQGDTG